MKRQWKSTYIGNLSESEIQSIILDLEINNIVEKSNKYIYYKPKKDNIL